MLYADNIFPVYGLQLTANMDTVMFTFTQVLITVNLEENYTLCR